ncbi:hypothetical protein [Streptomyces boluensis]|uniref:Uncharacterized protein n=1 Tax=Streptomyces boluensis TaxID=1775135 RepID=A0A964UTF0_9ACTN|nr:hypothetical protein [Streptomyces boluensis]NBE55054.1 hypothetical protein [Streptomyces boluensis]
MSEFEMRPSIFDNVQPPEPICIEVFADANHQGQSQKLPAYSGGGRDLVYSAADLQGAGGVGIQTISSLRFSAVKAVGYPRTVVLYAEDGCCGASKTFYEGTDWVGDDFNDRTCSIRITHWIL